MFQEKKTFWGYFAIGIIALIGGIIMFAITVPNWNATGNEVPADMGIIFTKVFSQQVNLKSGNLPYNPSLFSLGVEEQDCKKFDCSLRLLDGGKDFEMKMSKNGKTWRVRSTNMVPELVEELKNP